jgi:LuxR family maltose regulon positive regulatory protein
MTKIGLERTSGRNEADQVSLMERDFLLKTKLLIPPVRANHVVRPRLTSKLNDSLDKALTLVSAPAGYGKTTLLAEWAGTRHNSVGWVSLDEYDNEFSRLLAYLINALANIQTNFGSNTRVLLKASPPLTAPAILSSLINDISEIPDAFCLILDDYQFITNPLIHNAFSYLLEHLPPNMHLAVATRVDPPLPLPRLRSRNQLVEIREKDLRFTSEEVAEYLREGMGLELTAMEISALEARIEGWIVGLQTAALSMKDRHELSFFIQSFSGSNRYILDYLEEEVFNRQSEDVQEFLLETSILDQLCASLCEAVTCQAGCQRLLERIEQANLFLIPLDEERQWYRYHHLFTDILRKRLQQIRPKQLKEIHARAADWYEQHGWIAEAISHTLIIKDFKRAATLIEQNAMRMLSGGELTTFLSWLEALPAEFPSHRPWLLIYNAWAKALSGQTNELEPLLMEAECLISKDSADEETLDLLGNIAGVRAYNSVYALDMPQTIKLASVALQKIPAKNVVTRYMVTVVLVIANGFLNQLEKSCQAYRNVLVAAHDVGNTYISVTARCDLAICLKNQGKLHSANTIYKEAREILVEHGKGKSPIWAALEVGEGDLYREWNDLAGAELLIKSGIKYGFQRGGPDWLVLGYIAIAQLLQARGDLLGATNALQDAEFIIRNFSIVPSTRDLLQKIRVRLWLAKGELQKAVDWFEENKQAILYFPIHVPMALARVLIAQGRIDEALSLLSRLAEAAESGERFGNLIEILILRALAFKSSMNTSEALKVLEKALVLAEPENYVRVFLDEGRPMFELLDAILHQEGPVPKEYIGKLLVGFSDYSREPILSESITKREQEVLKLIASGMTNQQIAEKLVLSSGTVRAHTANIYRKLDVSNRIQAVVRAKELNLL